jgi:signal transduction histidine kinase
MIGDTAGGGAQRVLAIDDEPANLRAVRRVLAGECEVIAASSAGEAFEVLAREPVALALVDQRMPGMTGTEFLAETVRTHPRLIRIVVSGYADAEVLTSAINRGHVYHVLAKPWQAHELRQVVRRGLERRAADEERERLAIELARACERARREAEQKGRLLALTAHELGTPLHILLNALDLLDDGSVVPDATPFLASARRAAQWLVRGITQMNNAARVGRQPLRLYRERIDAGELLRELIDEIAGAAHHRRLTFEAARGIAVLRADRRWLRQALWDLLVNAVRFTPDGGVIRGVARCDGETVLLEVADNGLGISAELLDEIFEPFSAATGDILLHGSGVFDFGARGLGLGLALVKGIAEAHGGRVAVTSRLGSGSRFTLQLPGGAAENSG